MHKSMNDLFKNCIHTFFYRIDKSMSKESHVDISTAKSTQSYMHYFFLFSTIKH